MNTKVAKKNNKGFTLIELIVVIAIIAVLATILAPQYLRYVEKSRVASDEQYAEELKNTVKTTLADEAAAQDVADGNTVTWSSTGIGGKVTIGKGTTVSVANNDTGFAKELKTNLSGETIGAPKSKKYHNSIYTITISVVDDTVTAKGAWSSQPAGGNQGGAGNP